jgi:acetate---CoA ligase (ADP-forming)
MRTPFDEAGLFSPAAITIVGASERIAAFRSLMRNLTEPAAAGYPGTIQLVNRSGRAIGDRPVVTSPAELAGPPGLVFLMIPPEDCVAALDAMPSRPSGVVAYPGGSESGHAEAEAGLRGWARDHQVPVVGPQSTGFVRPAGQVRALVAPLRRPPLPGPVALIMQSSGLLGGTVNALTARGLGLDTAVSLGNGTALTATDVGAALLGRPSVACLALYLDAITDLDDFVELARLGQDAGKPVLLCLGGRSDIGRELVRSHTGQLATDQRVAEGIARQFDVILAGDIDELVLSAGALTESRFASPGPGAVAAMATSGGACAVVADALSAAGIPLPPPHPDVLRAAGVSAGQALNPLDLGAAALDSPDALNQAIKAFIADDAYSIHLNITAPGLPAVGGAEAQRGQLTAFLDNVRAAGKLPLLAAPVNSAGRDWPVRTWDGVVLADGTKEIVTKTRALWRWANRLGYEPGQPHARDGDAGPGPVTVLTGPAARELLSGVRMCWPDEVRVRDRGEVDAALSVLGYPVVAKAEAGLAHRAVAGGVITGLTGPRPARAACDLLLEKFGGSVSLTEQVDHGQELVLGFERHPVYGALLMIGLGGTGVGSAVSFLRLPATARQIGAVAGDYVRADADRELLVRTAMTFAECLAGRPDVLSADLNPLAIVAGQVICLDGKVHVTTQQEGKPPQ